MSVGLHIYYGLMGSGKTNFAVNDTLKNTTYKRVITNIPLTDVYKQTFIDVEFILFEKYDVNGVIKAINDENTHSLIIVDESQLVLIGSNGAICDFFAKRMTQIRQNDQDVILISQEPSMLPKTIRGVASDCYFFENQDIKGKQALTKYKHYKGGNNFSTKLIDEGSFNLVYGNYETSNVATTERPKDQFKRSKWKIRIVFLIAGLLFLLSGIGFYRVFKKFTSDSKIIENSSILPNQHFIPNVELVVDSVCYRSFHEGKNHVFFVLYDDGTQDVLGLKDFVKKKRCPFNQGGKK